MAEKQVAWLVTPREAPVVGAEGERLGEVRAVLGDDEGDIFHGLAMKPEGGGDLVEVPGARVERITTERVYTTIERSEVPELELYEEDSWFDFEGLEGIFRKRIKWEKDE
ncbi:MAG: PRC-barrel domain-containing protein [Actinomycetota bacterium]